MKRKTSIPHVVAQNIKERRAELGLIQAQLAERADISTTYLAEIETTKKSPSMEVLQRLADALNLRPYEFFIEKGIDDKGMDYRKAIRLINKDVSATLPSIISKTLDEITKTYLK